MAEEKKTITSMMEEKRVFPPSKEFSAKAHIKSLDQSTKAVRNGPSKTRTDSGVNRLKTWSGSRSGTRS